MRRPSDSINKTGILAQYMDAFQHPQKYPYSFLETDMQNTMCDLGWANTWNKDGEPERLGITAIDIRDPKSYEPYIDSADQRTIGASVSYYHRKVTHFWETDLHQFSGFFLYALERYAYLSEPLLVRVGRERFLASSPNTVQFVEDLTANAFLNDLVQYPHAYVLACCMDRQIKTERAWMIPTRIRDILGDFSMKELTGISQIEYQEMFEENSLHRFNDTMGRIFYNAVQRIATEYDCDASRIWSGKPGSAAVVYRFLQFDGVGVKIATMATNILARQFKIPFSDYYSIDVSPDTHVRRVMGRTGYVEKHATNESIIYKARTLCPEFPGIIDFSLWEIGRKWCHPDAPDCENCIVKDECMRLISN